MSNRTNTAVWIEKYKRWQIKVQKNGVRRPFYSSTPGRKGQKEANAKADAWLDSDVKGDKKIKALFEDYLKYKKGMTKEQWKKDKSAGETWILPRYGHRKISGLTEGDLDDIIVKAYAEGDLSKKSLENLRGTIQNFLKWCRKNNHTKLHPEEINIPVGAKVGKKSILQPDHLEILFSRSTTLYYGKEIEDELIHAYRTLVLTGCRPGELLGMEETDIIGDCVNLQRSINVDGEVTTGKNENAVRRFYLTPLAKEEIKQQLKQYPGDRRIFGDYLREQRLRLRWYAYCDHNGIPRITPYEMRHTFVSIIKGLPEAEIKMLVGHSRSMDTAGVYSHEVNGDLQRISGKIAYIFSSLLKSEEENTKLEEETKVG